MGSSFVDEVLIIVSFHGKKRRVFN